jgi:hypothetical protein
LEVSKEIRAEVNKLISSYRGWLNVLWYCSFTEKSFKQ